MWICRVLPDRTSDPSRRGESPRSRIHRCACLRLFFLHKTLAPNLPLAEIEGIDITRLADSGYTQGFAVDRVVGRYDPRRSHCWIIPGFTDLKEEQGTDIWALRRNRVSITPIHNRLTSHEEPESLPGVCLRLSQELSWGTLPVSDHRRP